MESVTLFYRNKRCRAGRSEYEEFDEHAPPIWQPKCIVVLLAAESRAALRDQLMEQGRILVDPLQLNLNYTTSTSDNPDLEVASANCALGRELRMLHKHDMAGQAERDRLVALQAELAQARVQHELFDRVAQGLSAYRPPASPPPPSPPPAPTNTPPAAPGQVSIGERSNQLRERVELLEVAVTEAATAIDLCVPSATNICGRSSERAPNPWVSRDGQACAGNGTWEALEGTYCGYWGSEVSLHLKHANLPAPPLTKLLNFVNTGEPRRRRFRRGLGASEFGRRALLLCKRRHGPQVRGHGRSHQPRGCS